MDASLLNLLAAGRGWIGLEAAWSSAVCQVGWERVAGVVGHRAGVSWALYPPPMASHGGQKPLSVSVLHVAMGLLGVTSLAAMRKLTQTVTTMTTGIMTWTNIRTLLIVLSVSSSLPCFADVVAAAAVELVELAVSSTLRRKTNMGVGGGKLAGRVGAALTHAAPRIPARMATCPS